MICGLHLAQKQQNSSRSLLIAKSSASEEGDEHYDGISHRVCAAHNSLERPFSPTGCDECCILLVNAVPQA